MLKVLVIYLPIKKNDVAMPKTHTVKQLKELLKENGKMNTGLKYVLNVSRILRLVKPLWIFIKDQDHDNG